MKRYAPLLLLLLLVVANAGAQDGEIRLYCVSQEAPWEFAVTTMGHDVEGNLLYPEISLPTKLNLKIAITDTAGDTLCSIDTTLSYGVYRAVWDSCGRTGDELESDHVYFLELTATSERKFAPFDHYVKTVFRETQTGPGEK